MAPSRGFSRILLQHTSAPPTVPNLDISLAQRTFSSFSEKLVDPANKVQSYISRSRDPYLNLSIEDHILRTSSPDSTVLFLYTNRPCVVIGRNQNPWTEVNLGILQAARHGKQPPKDTEPPAIGAVDLVRRRSGGGTVFHDEGNVNWSITCPRSEFTRDKHAEMVVRALRKLGVDRARVNERHDIVLDQGPRRHPVNAEDTHATPYTTSEGDARPLKVSGSAYKLTRARALHHATTLLASPNLHIIPQYLRSPARDYIEAKGVESVSSPVGNIGLGIEEFQTHLQEEFASMYANASGRPAVQWVGEEHFNIPEVRKGYDELLTPDWMWSQTPQFTLKLGASADFNFDLNVHHGTIKALDVIQGQKDTRIVDKLRPALVGQKLEAIGDWSIFLRERIHPWTDQCDTLAGVLDKLLPVPISYEP